MLILVDGKNAAKAAFHVNGKLKTRDGLQTGLAINLLAQIRKMMVDRSEGVEQVTFLWEGERCWRHDFFPEYKSNRNNREYPDLKPGEPDWRQQVSLLEAVLATLPIRQCTGTNLEADDLAYILKNPNGRTVLISNDFDWLQLVDHETWVYQSRPKIMVTPQNLTEITGYNSPAEIIEMFSICGDSGDFIPGVRGVGEKTALKYLRGGLGSHLATFKNIKSWMDDPNGYARSRTLFDMKSIPEHVKGDYTTQINEFDEKGFRALAERMEWNMVLRDFDAWTAPFRSLRP
jgi:DNA polymerase I